MNENLKVNSKTDILEFKRKHNLLVENGTIKANVSNIKSLSNDVINNLRCGDVVLKEDSSGKHAYLVSFKSDTGLCLTYCDASCVETQSYDKSGDNWVYNSEDKCDLINPNFNSVHANEIVENMEGYSFSIDTSVGTTKDVLFAGVVKTGNKITFVISIDITKTTESTDMNPLVGQFTLPEEIYNKLIPSQVGAYNFLDNRILEAFSSNTSAVNSTAYVVKSPSNRITFVCGISNFVNDTKYHLRYECTFLLSDNLVPVVQGE